MALSYVPLLLLLVFSFSPPPPSLASITFKNIHHLSEQIAKPLNSDTPPLTIFFEVAKPIRVPKTHLCKHLVLQHVFSNTYMKPPVVSNYTFPYFECGSYREFSKIVLEWNATCKGRQIDWIFGIWLNGLELFKSCTTVLRPTEIFWSVQKDITRTCSSVPLLQFGPPRFNNATTCPVSYQRNFRVSCSSSSDPLLVKAARGERVSRPPAWMMRQAGRYMAIYRKLAEKHPSFRERSETTDLIVEISLQPWNAFRPDGVIIFSDILTPLPAFGVPFDIEEVRGPVIQSPIRSEEDLKALHPIELDKLEFVAESLKILRREVEGKAAVLGFVGAPWTIATYIVEGGTTRTYSTIKSMCHTAPNVLRGLLSHLTQAISDYVVFQVESGAHCIQIFDSWGGQLPPHMWETWSKPYIEEIVSTVRRRCPGTPLVLYINGNGGLLERMKGIGVDVIGLDWTVDMADGRKRLGCGISVQGNVGPACLFSPLHVVADDISSLVPFDVIIFPLSLSLSPTTNQLSKRLTIVRPPLEEMSSNKGKDVEGSSRSSGAITATPSDQASPPPLSRYMSQKRRDWNTFGQYLRNQRPPVALSQCNSNQVLDFLRYLDQFGKTKVHLQGCVFYGQPEPPGPCTCPLKQAWGSLDALIGRLRAAYEEHGGLPETNPFASGAIRVYLREVRDSQAKARGIPYKKKKRGGFTSRLPRKAPVSRFSNLDNINS